MISNRLLPDRAAILTVVDDVVDGRPVTPAGAIVATGVPCRLTKRDPGDVVYDEAGSIITSADVITRYPLELGQTLEIGSDRWVVSDYPRELRGQLLTGSSAPVRRHP